MTYAPVDLTQLRLDILARTRLSGGSVGIVGDPAHAASGGYHEGEDDLRRIGRYHPSATSPYSGEDYSVRHSRDRAGITNAASAIDIGYNWPAGGRAAWLRFNNALVSALHGNAPDLSAIRAVNYSPDGVRKLRTDREAGWSVVASTDSVDIHTHIEFYRDSNGKRGPALLRLLSLIDSAIANPTPAAQEADMQLGDVIPRICDQYAPQRTLEMYFGDTYRAAQQDVPAIKKTVEALAATVAALPAGSGPTQDQVDAAVAKTMNSPEFLAGLGAAVASHIHVA